MNHYVKIESIKHVTHDVLQIRVEKPRAFSFTPGQATEVTVNKTRADIILQPEFEKLSGKNFINILSDENADGYAFGVITEEFIKAHCDGIDKIFYLCGPPAMMDAMEKYLSNLKVPVKSIVKEVF